MKEVYCTEKSKDLKDVAHWKDLTTFFYGLMKICGPRGNGVKPLRTSNGQSLLSVTSDINAPLNVEIHVCFKHTIRQ